MQLDILDIQGRVVATPFAGRVEAGARTIDWNLATRAGDKATAGIYFARLTGAGQTNVLRVVVVKP